jgi:hypothetical protein
MPAPRQGRLRRRVLWGGAVLVGTFLLMQAVPYGRTHSNGTPTSQARIPDPKAEALFSGACADCHSEKTEWPWYANVAPMSWLVQHDVEDGRGVFDVSHWDRPQPDLGEIQEQISSGGMPPLQYKLIHPAGRLSAAEKRRLVAGMTALYAQDPPGSGQGGG